MTDQTILKIANTPETEFLLQAELRAIHQRLEFKDGIDCDIPGYKYIGYVN